MKEINKESKIIDNLEQAKHFFLLGLENYNNKKYIDAERNLMASLNFAPDRLSTLINLSAVLIKLDKFEYAAEIISNAILLYPNNETLYLNRGQLLSKNKNWQMALDSYNKAVELKHDYSESYYNRGLLLTELKRLEEALASYDKAIEFKPDYLEALNNRLFVLKEMERSDDAVLRSTMEMKINKYDEALNFISDALHIDATNAHAYNIKGLVLLVMRRLDDALSCFNKAIEFKKDLMEAYFNRGLVLKELNRFDEAVASYYQAVNLKPNYSEAHFNLGTALHVQKHLKKALECYDKAIELKTDYAEAYYNRGILLKEQNYLDGALSNYNMAIKHKPDYAEVYSNRGIVLKELCRLDEALASYDKAINLRDDLVAAYSNRGIVLKELKLFDEALASYDKAIKLKPNYAEAYSNRGIVLQSKNLLNEALLSFEKAIEINFDYPEAHLNHGSALYELKRLDEALISFDKAIMQRADYSDAYFCRGNVLKDMVELSDAKESYLKALEFNPSNIEARWALMFISIPTIFKENENLEISRELFSYELEQFNQWLNNNYDGDTYKGVGSTQPFYLAYQDLNNKELLSQHGEICSRIMNCWYKSCSLHPIQKPTGGKIKVGIVGEQFHNHSVWNAITKGIVENLDIDKFEIHIFYLGNTSDNETKIAELKSTSFTKNKLSLMDWCNSIIDKKLNAIIFPEISMHPLTTKIASLRLCPIQIATWGHPETTGLPTIDYYLTAELFETSTSKDLYTEKLIKLPNLGCFYSKMHFSNQSLENYINQELDLNFDLPILICPGTQFKYAPQNDWIFVEIAKQLGDCKFIFFDGHSTWTNILKKRFETIFRKSGLNFDKYIYFSPWLTSNEFHGLMKKASVYLDTIGFSGFNTAMQAIECALPIVTIDGNYMRGRLASGILKRIGVTELIAESEIEYINIVVRLASDIKYQKIMANKIIECRAILYNDMEPVKALEDFLISACI